LKGRKKVKKKKRKTFFGRKGIFQKIASLRQKSSPFRTFGGLPILVVDTHKQWFGERRRDTLG
jgi:hypothetical protein